MRTLRTDCAIFVLVCAGTSGCGDRPAGWDTSPNVRYVKGLQGSVALVDEAVKTVTFLGVSSGLDLSIHRQSTGTSPVAAEASPDGTRLYVLTQGTQPRLRAEDDLPALWVYDGKGSGALIARYDLDSPLSGLAIDPQGKYVVVFPAGKASTFVENPNELVVVDVTQPSSPTNPVSRTLRSFGGTPQKLTFTPQLSLPTGPRRLLVVETTQEVSLLDLDHLDRQEVTVVLNSADGTTSVRPEDVLVDDGDPAKSDDARIAVRTNQAGVILLTLTPLPESKVGKVNNDYDVVFNIIGLSSTPTDFAFVQTDAGRRLAAMEPAQKQASLIDLDTTVVTTVELPSAYGRMAVVTDRAGGGNGNDIALLWGGYTGAAGVAFWTLGTSVGQPYRSIEVLTGVASNVESVLDVAAPNDTLKVLVSKTISTTSGRPLYVLDLRARTASPLVASSASVSLNLSGDGQRAWLYEPSARQIAKVDLTNLHPINLYLDRQVASLFDIARASGGRAMVAIHNQGTFGATVFDAERANDAESRAYAGLLQGGF